MSTNTGHRLVYVLKSYTGFNQPDENRDTEGFYPVQTPVMDKLFYYSMFEDLNLHLSDTISEARVQLGQITADETQDSSGSRWQNV